MIRDFFSQENIKKWLLSQAKNAGYTLLILVIVSLWSIRTGLFELSSQTQTSYQNVNAVVELQSTLLNRLVAIQHPSSSLDWDPINALNDRLKYRLDESAYTEAFTELQATIMLLSETFYVETDNSPFVKLTGLLSDSQKHLSIRVQHLNALNGLYESQKDRFPHRYFDSFYDLPTYPKLSLPEGFEHLEVVSTLQEQRS